jgi:hypothetical protein
MTSIHYKTGMALLPKMSFILTLICEIKLHLSSYTALNYYKKKRQDAIINNGHIEH